MPIHDILSLGDLHLVRLACNKDVIGCFKPHAHEVASKSCLCSARAAMQSSSGCRAKIILWILAGKI